MQRTRNTYEAAARARKAERLADAVDHLELRDQAIADPALLAWDHVAERAGVRSPSEATIAAAVGILKLRSEPFDWSIFDD